MKGTNTALTRCITGDIQRFPELARGSRIQSFIQRLRGRGSDSRMKETRPHRAINAHDCRNPGGIASGCFERLQAQVRAKVADDPEQVLEPIDDERIMDQRLDLFFQDTKFLSR